MDNVLTTRPSKEEKNNRRSLKFKEICIRADKTRMIQYKNILYIYTVPLINKIKLYVRVWKLRTKYV